MKNQNTLRNYKKFNKDKFEHDLEHKLGRSSKSK